MVEKPAYIRLLGMARRHARRPDEAEDIVQDVLVAALAAGRYDFSSPDDQRWMAGAIKRRAAFDARSALRRQLRDTRWQAERPEAADMPDATESVAIGPLLQNLAPALRITAALALSGHTRAEISYLLDISDTALRQRIRSLRKALVRIGVSIPADMTSLNLDLAYGTIRQALQPFLRRHGGTFASHDPDGHLFVIKSSQKH
ncbi:transcriptional regulator [Natronospirillum operosum]|uniref:Transcriptional regulator n=1 Tax=Natronospirillum operosum TaxID=2759953 RepID=A0A4Z0WC86_9GAMM|nr:sigma factor [Natronospirillum operosum]TGG95792.1 transcriptional regulator [Natronospirillum operosum]